MLGRPIHLLVEQLIMLAEQVIMMMMTEQAIMMMKREMMRMVAMLMMDLTLQVFVIFFVMLVGRHYGGHF